MIAITKKEKDIIVAKYPNTTFVRTMKQDSKRHHYYMVEGTAQMRLLRSLRGAEEKQSRQGSKKGGW